MQQAKQKILIIEESAPVSEKAWAALNTKEETRHIHQHGQPKICPMCDGTGSHDVPYSSGQIKCFKCNGTGKLQA